VTRFAGLFVRAGVAATAGAGQGSDLPAIVKLVGERQRLDEQTQFRIVTAHRAFRPGDDHTVVAGVEILHIGNREERIRRVLDDFAIQAPLVKNGRCADGCNFKSHIRSHRHALTERLRRDDWRHLHRQPGHLAGHFAERIGDHDRVVARLVRGYIQQVKCRVRLAGNIRSVELPLVTQRLGAVRSDFKESKIALVNAAAAGLFDNERRAIGADDELKLCRVPLLRCR